MRRTRGRVCGTTEDRINRFMRMCLEWQYNLRNGTDEEKSKPTSYYFIKYNVGKYKKKYFKNIANAVIDRDFVISLMDKIAQDRIEYDKSIGK